MKKNILLSFIVVFALTFTFSKVYAVGNGTGLGNSDSSRKSDTATSNGNGTGSGQAVGNENMNQTKNKGEDTLLKVNEQEMEGVESPSYGVGNSQEGNGKRNNLTETRSFVSSQIKKLLSTESAEGGIGEQVREWARVQQETQTRIQQRLEKIESRSDLLSSLLGPDYSSLNELRQEMQQNRVRVSQLEELLPQLDNDLDIANVEEMITLLSQENTAISDKILEKERDSGVFGWLVKMFVK